MIRLQMLLIWHITKQVRNGFSIVRSSNCLSEHHAHVYALDLLAVLHVCILGQGVRHNHSLGEEEGVTESIQKDGIEFDQKQLSLN